MTVENVANNPPQSLMNDPVFDCLLISHPEWQVYKAGALGYERPFLRDGIITGTLSQNAKILREMLRLAAHLQGEKYDPRTGEQPGKIFHEYDFDLQDGVELVGREGKTTKYAGCDTTALFLIGHEEYRNITQDRQLSEGQKENISKAAMHILDQLDSRSIFVEDPGKIGSDGYALRVTYWKDSILYGRENGEPHYPVVYPLAHIQNMAGLRAASKLLGTQEFSQEAEKMAKVLPLLIDPTTKMFYVAIDSSGAISGINSDSLHALAYLEPGDISNQEVAYIVDAVSVLETDFGYRTMSPEMANKMFDEYHAKTIWTHEQAQIHNGASKHQKQALASGDKISAWSYQRVMNVAYRVNNYLKENPESNPELFVIGEDHILPGGCDPQLWAIGARRYFESVSTSHTNEM